MKNFKLSRRSFIKDAAVASLAVSVAPSSISSVGVQISDKGKLAILGGKPVRQPGPIGEKWPYLDQRIVDSVMETTKSRVWTRIDRGARTPQAEKDFAELVGTKYCVGTGSGTQSLTTCVYAMDIGPGDEVITSPYTDFGTIASILSAHALPVLVDIEPDTFQLDPDEVEKAINENTKAIMPVHIFGVSCNMERIMAIAGQHNLLVIEDACQAVLARYQGKALGTIGDVGCFSFQASKAIATGEGGAIVGNDEELMDKCYTVMNRGASKKGTFDRIGPKFRMNEFQAALLEGQFPGVRNRFAKRNENANYLRNKLKDFKPLLPQRYYPGTEGSAYYHFGMVYNKDLWGVDRSKFLKAIQAEGIPLGAYIPYQLNKEPWIDYILGLKSYKMMYSPARLRSYKESMDLKNNERVIKEIMVSFGGSGTLLADRKEMDNIYNAIVKVYENRDKLHSI